MLKFFLLVMCFLATSAQAQDWRSDLANSLGDGGVYVEDASGRQLVSHRADDLFVPASTIKLATAACALKRLGPDFRFPTDFLLANGGVLAVKGYGDPMLVSEELAAIARELKRQGVKGINGILLDTSFFSPHIVIDGVERSANPYDALNSALLANFNTINIRKLKNGRVESAETQTPLTPVAEEMAKKLRPGSHRINLAANPQKALRYVGELLTAFLAREGIAVSGDITHGITPSGARLIYRHQSSKRLTDILRGMLDFSTNLTANQLFLTMGAQGLGAPATVEKGVKVVSDFLRRDVGWRNFQIAEGSGLSRQTRVTPREMIALLRYFMPHRELLPIKDRVFQAKTGTLIGVNTYAGYFPLANGGLARFVILVNDQVPFEHKFRMAKMIYAGLNGQMR